MSLYRIGFEHVLKYNPNHGPDGRFASGGGGRRGGTAGAPTEDAFGNPLSKGRRRGSGDASHEAALRHGYDSMEHVAAEIARYNKERGTPYGMRAASVPAAITGQAGDPRFNRGLPQPIDPSFHRGPTTVTLDPNFHQGVGDAELAGSTPYTHALNPAKVGPAKAAISNPYGSVGERAERYRQTGRLPTYGTTARERSQATPPSVRGSLTSRRSSFS